MAEFLGEMPAITTLELHIATEAPGNIGTISRSVYSIMGHISAHLPKKLARLRLDVYLRSRTVAFMGCIMTLAEWGAMDRFLHVHGVVRCIEANLISDGTRPGNQHRDDEHNSYFTPSATLTQSMQDRLPLSLGKYSSWLQAIHIINSQQSQRNHDHMSNTGT